MRFPHINDFRNPDFLCKYTIAPRCPTSAIISFLLVLILTAAHAGAATTVSIWSQIEAGLAISAGSFATLRPLYRILLIKLRLTTDNTTPSYGRHNTGGGYINNKNNTTSAGGGGAGNSTKFSKSRHSTVAGRNMFGMTTFSRMDDDLVTDDDDSAHGRRSGRGTPSLVGSTVDLHSKKTEVVVKKDDRAGDYSVQIIAQKGGYNGTFDDEAGRHHHKREASDRAKGLQIHYTKEFGSDA